MVCDDLQGRYHKTGSNLWLDSKLRLPSTKNFPFKKLGRFKRHSLTLLPVWCVLRASGYGRISNSSPFISRLYWSVNIKHAYYITHPSAVNLVLHVDATKTKYIVCAFIILSAQEIPLTSCSFIYDHQSVIKEQITIWFSDTKPLCLYRHHTVIIWPCTHTGVIRGKCQLIFLGSCFELKTTWCWWKVTSGF